MHFYLWKCSLTLSPRYTMSVLLPLALYACYGCLLTLYTILHRAGLLCCACLTKRLPPLRLMPGLQFGLFTLVPLLYIPTSRSVLVLFDCTRLPDGSYALDVDLGKAWVRVCVGTS